ncbi:MAG: SDR family NAD(P)-dependent oxidoreductase, partial [Caulobacterales bacterium]|nr:SDR family NAD(P)-dependent oxidoreductase [Caulobacterales bacterium]
MSAIGNTVIVGASASVGGAVVDRFADAAPAVLASYRRAPARSERAHVAHVPLDLLDSASRARFVDEAGARLDGIDVLVMLAGLLPGKALGDYDDALMDEVVAVNFTGQAK